MIERAMTIGAALAGQVLAISAEHCGALLAQAVPLAADASALTLEHGERFVISGRLAVVPVQGLLTANAAYRWTTYHGLAETLDQLAANDDVAAIAMPINSPGGTVIGLQAAVEAMRRARAVKPVHALVHPMATSAAYWIAAQASDITLTAGSIVGSVGIIMEPVAPMQPDMMGDQSFVITSEHARGKRPDPSTDEGRAIFQTMVDEIERQMLADIAAGRGIALPDLTGRLTKTDDPRDGGGVFEGQDAQARGLVDYLDGEAAFYARIRPDTKPAPRRGARAYAARAMASTANATL